MSTGGIPGVIATNIASSIAGSQVRSADETAAKANAAQANANVAANSFAARTLGDVAQTGQSADRDADGRLDDTGTEPHAPRALAGGSTPKPVPRADDAFGERGGSLDVDG